MNGTVNMNMQMRRGDRLLACLLLKTDLSENDGCYPSPLTTLG